MDQIFVKPANDVAANDNFPNLADIDYDYKIMMRNISVCSILGTVVGGLAGYTLFDSGIIFGSESFYPSYGTIVGSGLGLIGGVGVGFNLGEREDERRLDKLLEPYNRF